MTPTDQQLISDYQRLRQTQAIDVLAARHRPMVARVCFGMLNQSADVEDAVQTTFLTMTRKLDQIRDRSSIAGWLFHCAVRCCLQIRHKNRRSASSELPKEIIQIGDTPEVALMKHQAIEILITEIDKLPAKYREVIVLICLEERSRAETARVLNRTEPAIKGLLARGRSLLRSRLSQSSLALLASVVGMGGVANKCFAGNFIDQHAQESLHPVSAQLEQVIQMHAFHADRFFESQAWYNSAAWDAVGYLSDGPSDFDQVADQVAPASVGSKLAARLLVGLSLVLTIITLLGAAGEGQPVAAATPFANQGRESSQRSSVKQRQDGADQEPAKPTLDDKSDVNQPTAEKQKLERKWIFEKAVTAANGEKMLAIMPVSGRELLAIPSGKKIVFEYGHYTTGETGFRILLGAKNELLREFLDTNGDSKLDSWQYKEVKNGFTTYVELDTDFDGKVDCLKGRVYEMNLSCQFIAKQKMNDRVWDLVWSKNEPRAADDATKDPKYMQPGDKFAITKFFGAPQSDLQFTVDQNYQMSCVEENFRVNVRGRTPDQVEDNFFVPWRAGLAGHTDSSVAMDTEWGFRRLAPSKNKPAESIDGASIDDETNKNPPAKDSSKPPA